MASTKTTPKKITPPRRQHSASVGSLNVDVPKKSLSHHIDHLVEKISFPALRKAVGSVFEDLLHLLGCLRLIESQLRQPDAASKTVAFFQIIQHEARALVKFINDEALCCEGLSEEVSETLDGITFAINHDFQRVFENQQLGGDAAPYAIIDQLFRDHSLLTNCLQQSTISLAVTFDPKLDGTKLFDNCDRRYRQSIQLCEDFSILLKLVEACAGSRKGSALANLRARIELFRNESLECLMHSDRPEFEAFCEKISAAETSTLELESVLHQFSCYLETLLGQVRMRAVLANVLPAHFGTDRGSQRHDEKLAWDPFAVAV